MIEVFAGTGHLSQAFRKQGFETKSYDIVDDCNHDMANANFVQKMAKLLGSGKVAYVHFGIPCKTYSTARYPRLRTPG